MTRDCEGRTGVIAGSVIVNAPSPPEGEGYAEAQRRRMGEGLERLARTPHPSEFADASELPSPSRGEGTITATSLAARSTRRGTRAARFELLP